MTTTGAAKQRSLIESLRPRVVIVEEAAEVLEASIITSISEHTEHLILIGDHKQLRPSVEMHKMETEYHMHISLFERLIRTGLPYSQLAVQRRMKTNIAKLIAPLYPTLKTHESVNLYPEIKGVKQNLFFITHSHAEDHPEKGSTRRSNFHEVKMTGGLARYLIQQDYLPSKLTILTAYGDQLLLLRDELRRLAKGRPELGKIRVTTIDNYQGEENGTKSINFACRKEPQY